MSDIKDSYTFVSDNKENWQCIGINGGKFNGVIYKYGKDYVTKHARYVRIVYPINKIYCLK